MAVNFIPVDRDTPDYFPATVQEYLPADHLARFVVEMVEQLDLRPLLAADAGTGSRPSHPAMLVALIFYGYATGVFSSRKLAQATYDSIAFRFICANTHPDHRTIADFRKRFLGDLEGLLTQMLLIAQAIEVLKLGTVSLDGTKIKANASKHKALSWAHANRLEGQIQGEVAELMRLAEQADNIPWPAPLDIPAELERREDRLRAIATAKDEIQARAQARFEAGQAECLPTTWRLGPTNGNRRAWSKAERRPATSSSARSAAALARSSPSRVRRCLPGSSTSDSWKNWGNGCWTARTGPHGSRHSAKPVMKRTGEHQQVCSAQQPRDSQ